MDCFAALAMAGFLKCRYALRIVDKLRARFGIPQYIPVANVRIAVSTDAESNGYH
jgi:hypothetical protein